MQSLAPSEYFEGIKFNYSFYTTGDTKVTLEYVNNNFLKCTGYAYSRAISTSFNGIIYCLGGIDTTTINASGLITSSTGFQGNGAQLTNLNATNISDGTLNVAFGGTGLSTLAVGQLLIGNDTKPIIQSANLIWDISNNNLGIGKNPAQKLNVNGTIAATLFSGSGASLTGLTEGQIPVLTAAKIPDLNASKITTGTINNDRITLTVAKIPDLDAAKITVGTINNDRITLTAAKIPDLNADKITAGTINNDRITLTAAKIPDLDAAKITEGTINNGRLPTNYGITLGIGITPTAPLHLYHSTNARLLLDTTTSGTGSIEFRRGTGFDIQNDYRFINDTDSFIKLQYENNQQDYGDATAQLAWFTPTYSIIHKNTQMNGRVGIGTTFHATRSLEVLGDANISGTLSSGSLSVSGPANISSSTANTTSLTIQNNFTASIPTEIVVAGTTSTIIGTIERCITFPYSGTGTTKDYTFTTTENLICDILIVGGGGGGSGGIGAGGGAGGVVWIENTQLNNGTLTINVGKGGTGGIANAGGGSAGIIGGNSSVINGSITITADRGGSPYSGVNNGGSGAGADGYSPDGGLTTVGGKIDKTSSPSSFLSGSVSYYGTNGGNSATSVYGGGGGGGAKNNTGVNGGNNIAGIGGEGLDIINGKDLKTYLNITNTIFGEHINNKVYFGGGGGGSGGSAVSGTGQLGGLGGGGNGASGSGVKGEDAQQNTGGGGGGGSTGYGAGGNGGSGIVIIRYRGLSPTSSSSIELLRGTNIDSKTDYRIGNYDGTFKVRKSINNNEIDVISINETTAQMFVAGGISTNSSITALTLRSIAALICDTGISSTGNITTSSGNISTTSGNINSSGSINAATYLYAASYINSSGFIQGAGSANSWRLTADDVWIRFRRDPNETTHRDLAVGKLFTHNTLTVSAGGVTVAGASSFSNTVTFTGGLNKATGMWYFSTDGYRRVHYEHGGETYYEGGGAGYNNGINYAHVFRRQYGDADIFIITTNGSFSHAGTYQSWSDIRIKKEIEDINDDNALQMILAIEPKTYKYIDSNKSKERVYGFIAQQIKEVVPEAVVIQNNIIPNIYKLCRCEENKKIYVALPPEVVGKLIQLSELGKYKIVLVEEEYIEVEKHMQSVDIPDGDNMVYGYEVDDFHTINKDYIFTLNVCATQELHRRIESQDKRIKELETKLEKLISYIYQ